MQPEKLPLKGCRKCLRSRLSKIITGGQTGADRAAWDAALEAGIAIGGFVPKGRLAEDGPVPDRYPGLIETNTVNSSERTRLNVISSEGTLILSHGIPGGGTKLAEELAAQYNKPRLHIDLSTVGDDEAIIKIIYWLDSGSIRVLNIAGPRASEDPAIYERTVELLRDIFRRQKESGTS